MKADKRTLIIQTAKKIVFSIQTVFITTAVEKRTAAQRDISLRRQPFLITKKHSRPLRILPRFQTFVNVLVRVPNQREIGAYRHMSVAREGKAGSSPAPRRRSRRPFRARRAAKFPAGISRASNRFSFRFSLKTTFSPLRERDPRVKHKQLHPVVRRQNYFAHTSFNTRSVFPPMTFAISSSEYPCFTRYRIILWLASVGFSIPATYLTSSQGR